MKTISPEYVKLNQELHKTKPSYGAGSERYALHVTALLALFRPDTVLDYGCGKGRLESAVRQLSKRHNQVRIPRTRKIRWCNIWHNYDPAVPDFAAIEENRTYDLVVCTDVLEHVEPDYLDNVLGDIAKRIGRVGFLSIACRESNKTLNDGRNAHLIVKCPDWWYGMLDQHFIVHRCVPIGPDDLTVLVFNKGDE